MASNRDREQRRLQRVRGAGTRQIKDVDFGLGFPSVPASQPQRSPHTPIPEIPIERSTRRTPVPTTKESAKARSPTPKASSSYIDADTSTKRRRLEKSSDTNPFSSAKSTRLRSRAEEILKDSDERDPLTEPAEADELGEQSIFATPTPGNQSSGIAIEEVAESPKNAPGSGRRQQTGSGEATVTNASLLGALVGASPSSKSRIQAKTPDYRRTSRLSQESSVADEIDELSPDQPEKGKISREQFSSDEEQEQEEAEAIDDIEAATYLSRKGKRKYHSDEEEASDGLEQPMASKPKSSKQSSQRKRRPKSSPVAQRQPKIVKKPASGAPNTGETVPVVVHRLTKAVVYEEDDPDADILNADIPFARRSGVSAVDVFAQFCEEIIESGLATLEEGGSSAEDQTIRREYRTKLRAVEGFQEELRARLLELAVLLDTDYLLNKRVRAAQKEKIQLREDLLRIRAEREQIALRMDEVRTKHENRNKKLQEQTVLSTSLHDIELAVSLGVEKAPPSDEKSTFGLTTLLKTVAAEASSKSSEGGILKQVKDFNDFLERAALTLEGRS